MKKYIHIRSKIPAKISINGENIPHPQPDILCNDSFYIAFFPSTAERYLPCAVSTYGECYPSSITKIPYKDNHYEIIYNPTLIPDKNCEIVILNKKYGNCVFSITNSSRSFINIVAPNFTYSSTTEILKTVDFKSNDGMVITTGTIDEEKKYILIFNTKTKKILLESVVKKIEKSKTGLKALKDNASFLGYGIVYDFNYSSKKLDSYSIYTTPSAISSQPELIPMLFLESLKYNDFKNAKNYLENKDVSNSHLENFFGKVERIYFNGYSNDINYTVYANGEYKSFTFKVIEDKIVDIEENPLNLI